MKAVISSIFCLVSAAALAVGESSAETVAAGETGRRYQFFAMDTAVRDLKELSTVKQLGYDGISWKGGLANEVASARNLIQQHNLCNMPGVQSGIQSLPRELSLPEDGVLRIKPLRELETLRAAETVEPDITVKGDSTHLFKRIAGDTIELNLTIEPGSAKEFGVNVFCTADGTGFPITIQAGNRKLAIGKIAAPFELKPGEALNLRVFLDKGMVEVFANDR